MSSPPTSFSHLSTAICILELFHLHTNSQNHFPLILNLSNCNAFELVFLSDLYNAPKPLSLLDLQLTLTPPFLKLSRTTDEPEVNLDLKTQKKTLEEHFVKARSTLPYKSLAESVLAGCSRIISEMCPYLKLDKLKEMCIQNNMVSGVPEMIPYEIKWCAWPDYGFVSMPDVAGFPDEHLEMMRQGLGGSHMTLGRFLCEFLWSCIRAPCHEVIHLVQRIAEQRANTYSSEHDASYIMMPLMWVLAQEKDMEQIFVPSLATAILVSLSRASKVIWDEWDESTKTSYQKWRSAFGLIEVPGWKDDQNGLLLESQFKFILAVEGFCPRGPFGVPDRTHLRSALDLLFKGRTGNVLDQELRVDDNLKIIGNRIMEIMSPVGDQWQQYFKNEKKEKSQF